MQRENTALIDWLSVTSKSKTPEDMMRLIGLTEGWTRRRGVHGYAEGYYRDSISIFFGGRADMGVWLEMSGSGCRAFETYSTADYSAIFGEILSSDDMNLTRLDVAFDEYTGILDMDRLCDDTRQGKFRSNSDYWRVEESSQGKTIYLGSPVSKVLVRIYDKLAERLAKVKNKDDREKVLAEIPHWIRCELQLRDGRAAEFVRYLMGTDPKTEIEEPLTLGQAYAGVLIGYADYGYETAARGHPEKSVWHRFPYWQNFLGDCEKLSIYRKPGIDYNLQRATNYIQNIAGNAVDALLKIKGVGGFVDMIAKRRITQNPKYVELIRQHGTFEKRYQEEFEAAMRGGKDEGYAERFALFLNASEPIFVHGERYVMCTECGEILPSYCFSVVGGSALGNFGVCRKCKNKGIPAKIHIEKENET